MVAGAILLLVAALALVAAELFLPSHGLLALLAVGCAIGAIALAYRASPALALTLGFVVLVASPAVFYGAVRIYPRTPMGKKVLLQSPVAASGFNHESEQLAGLVGRQGVAMTMLRPAGSIEVDGQMIDALSDSEVIEAGTRVEVIRVSGLKVFVKPVG